MPETTPDTQKYRSCATRSLCVKAALSALVFAGGLALALGLASLLPEKSAAWRTALPQPGVTAEQAKTAMMRAQSLHEAAVRPKLIAAGFASARDAIEDRHRRTESMELTSALWTMRALPEVHDALLATLLDASMPPHTRKNIFYGLGMFLSHAAFGMEKTAPRGHHHASRADEWFRTINAAPAAFAAKLSEEEQQEYTARRTLAQKVLPVLFAGVSRDSNMQELLAAGDEKSRNPYIRDLTRAAQRAVRTLWLQRNDPAFFPLAKELMASSEGSLAERYNCLSLLAQKPGLPTSEYLLWNRDRNDLRSIRRCLGATPAAYAFFINDSGELGVRLRAAMKQQGTLVLDGWHGPGVTLTKTERFVPALPKGESLYLLVDMALAMKDAPTYDLGRAHPIFAGTPLRHLGNQPLVLPLNPANASDAAVLEWYNDKGWQAGRILLFSATGSALDVARHWGSTHLLWWHDDKRPNTEDAQLAYLHPESGHFMLGLLPQIRGKAASRFLGPVTGLWFGTSAVTDSGWAEDKYEARPEPGVSPLPVPTSPRTSPILARFSCAATTKQKPAPYADATATVAIGASIHAKLNASWQYNYLVGMAQQLLQEHPGDATPMQAFSFSEKTLKQLREWDISRSRHTRSAISYLWQFRNDQKTVALLTGIFSKKDIPARSRMEQARQALSSPEKKGE